MNIIKVGEFWINLANVAYIRDREDYPNYDDTRKKCLRIYFTATAEDSDMWIQLTDENRIEFLGKLERYIEEDTLARL